MLFSGNETNLTDSEIFTIRTVAKVAASFSLFSSSLVFFLYWFFKEIRHISLELVVWLCISNFFFNITPFFPYSKDEYTMHSTWCAIQSYMINAFQNSSLIWCGIIGYTAYIGINNPHLLESKSKKYRISFICLALIFPLVIAFMYV